MQISNIGDNNSQFSVLAANILTSFHLVIFMSRLVFKSSANDSSASSLNATSGADGGAMWLVLKLSAMYAWFRLIMIIVTLLLHIYVALRILQNAAKKCTGCRLFANVCAANCINLGIWTLIAIEESRVWDEDLGPKLCRIHLQGLHFWTTFIMVNIIIIGVLNSFALKPKQKTILIFGFSWIATVGLFIIPVLTSFWDATESRGFFDFATVADGSAVNSYGLMICEQNLLHERDMITLRYLTSALPLAFFALLIAFMGTGNSEETCTPFSFFEIQSSIEEKRHKNSFPQQVTADGIYVKNFPNNNRNEPESCVDCYYTVSGPIMASLFLFHFFWESVFQPLMILYCAYSSRNHFFDVGSVCIAVLMAYMPIYAYVGDRQDRNSEEQSEETTDSEDEELIISSTKKSPPVCHTPISV